MAYILLTYLLAPFWWLGSRRRRSPQDKMLIIDIAGLGDVVCSTAVSRALRQHFPEAHIDILVDARHRDLFAADTHIDQVLALPPDQGRGWRGRWRLTRLMRPYPILICLCPSAALLTSMCWSGSRLRLSVLPDVRKTSYQLLRPLLSASCAHQRGYPYVQTQLDLLQALGVHSQDRRKSLTVQDRDRQAAQGWLGPQARHVGLMIGSGLALKALSPATLLRLIELASQAGDCELILLGGPAEETLATQLLQALPASMPVRNGCGVWSLDQLPGLLASLDLLIGVDSGLLHMADALDLPLVCLSGPAAIEEQGPQGTRVRILRSELACVPCSRPFVTPTRCARGDRACVLAWSAEAIWQAAQSLLLPAPAPRIETFHALGEHDVGDQNTRQPEEE